MDALRRGWVGLGLFFAALLLMPILVFGYDNNRPHGSSTASASPARPSPAATSLPGDGDPDGSPARSPLGAATGVTPAPGPAPIAFAGVQQGDVISGFRTIRVQTSAYAGPLEFVLNGPIAPYREDLSRPPYLFTPHAGGWETSQVPDGLYTLTAIPTGSTANSAISISFTVSNGNSTTS